jgi:hypothetical protein
VTESQCCLVLACCVVSGIDNFGNSGVISENEDVRLNKALTM